MFDDIFKKINNYILNATDVILVAIVAESCMRQKPILVEQIKKFISEKDPTIKLFDICIPEEEMPLPRIATQIVYFYVPGNTNPIFHRAGLLSERMLERDIITLRKVMQGKTFETIMYPENPGIEKKIDEMIASENIDHFPSMFQQARNFAVESWKASKKLMSGGSILASSEIAFERYSICQKCPFLENSRCKKCGCFMEAKTHIATSECPINKWSKVDV